MPAVGSGAVTKVPAPAGCVKGTLVVARMKYLRALGPDACERVLRRLSQSDQQVLRGMLLPSSWYAADLLVRLEMTIAAVLAKGDRRALFVDMGRFSADTNLGPGGVQRPYLREDDPHFLLRNAPRMFASQHSGGTRTYEQTGPKSAVVRTLDPGAEAGADDCLTAVGWFRRAIELSGGQSVVVDETRCRARGAPCCEYVCRWA
ncbi:MAG TPA: TIGR02265 family protein [Anaeromyxobacter sp.]|nr:TIGR02265 family protein [Anaeromyxobacter sp.]